MLSRICANRSAMCSGKRLSTRFEAQTNLRPIELLRAEVLTSARQRDVQTVPRRQHSITRIQPDRTRLIRFHRDVDIHHVSRRPQRVLHLDVQRKQPTVSGFDVHRWYINCNAIETCIEVLPAIRSMPNGATAARQPEIVRNQHVDNGHRQRRSSLGADLGRRAERPAAGQSHDRRSFVWSKRPLMNVVSSSTVGYSAGSAPARMVY